MKGEYKGINVKFIGCYCNRCKKGKDEIHNTDRKFTDREYATYSEKFFEE